MLKNKKVRGQRLFFLEKKDDNGGYLYHDWMTVKEIAALPECIVTASCVKGRLNTGVIYESVWETMITPQNPAKSSKTIRENRELGPYGSFEPVYVEAMAAFPVLR